MRVADRMTWSDEVCLWLQCGLLVLLGEGWLPAFKRRLERRFGKIRWIGGEAERWQVR